MFQLIWHEIETSSLFSLRILKYFVKSICFNAFLQCSNFIHTAPVEQWVHPFCLNPRHQAEVTDSKLGHFKYLEFFDVSAKNFILFQSTKELSKNLSSRFQQRNFSLFYLTKTTSNHFDISDKIVWRGAWAMQRKRLLLSPSQ